MKPNPCSRLNLSRGYCRVPGIVVLQPLRTMQLVELCPFPHFALIDMTVCLSLFLKTQFLSLAEGQDSRDMHSF